MEKQTILTNIQEATHLTENDIDYITVAVEKSIPKRVIDDFAHGLYGSCPGCFSIRTYGENYCSRCGQKIFFEVEKVW